MEREKSVFWSNLFVGLLIIALIVTAVYCLDQETACKKLGMSEAKHSERPSKSQGWGRFRPRGEEASSMVLIRRIQREGKEYFFIETRNHGRPEGFPRRKEALRAIPSE